MKPKESPIKGKQKELFRVELSQLVDLDHALVKLAGVVDWGRLEEWFGQTYCPDGGRAMYPKVEDVLGEGDPGY
jgi:IS5 family transposase